MMIYPYETAPYEIENLEFSISDSFTESISVLEKEERYFCLWIPSIQDIQSLFTKFFSFTLIYATLWGLLGSQALPGSAVFALTLLIVVCYIGGKIIELFKLPGLCGMLIVGFLFRNLPSFTYFEDIPFEWATSLRNGAFVIILLRAGLQLDPSVLKRIGYVCASLSFLPSIAEAFTVAIVAHFIMDMPWTWTFSLGFTVAGVSPAVVVPSMLLLQEKGFGVDKGIPTLALAASSFDNVLAIMGFGITIGMAFSTGDVIWTVFKGPLEVIVGILYGSVVGIISWYLPGMNGERKVFYRVIIVTFGGLAASFISNAFDLRATGALASLTLAFVVALKWRKDEDRNVPVANVEAGIWFVMEIFLFGLIGAEVSFSDLKENVGDSALVVIIGLCFRLIVTYFSLAFSHLNWKEKIFVSVSWIPKATVQAAIGPVALDMATTANLTEYVTYGRKILTTAVLSIILTAPVGAIAIAILSPYLLQKTVILDSSKLSDNNKKISYGAISSACLQKQ